MTAYFDAAGRPKAVITIGGVRAQVSVEALIDTGFEGYVCIPVRLATQLGLELIADQYVEYADGTVKSELLFSGTVVSDGTPRGIEVSLTRSDEPLIGTSMLADAVVTLDFPNRRIDIKAGRTPGLEGGGP